MNSNKQYYIFLGTIVILSLLVFPFVTNNISKKVDEIRPMAENFFKVLKKGDLKQANEHASNNLDLDDFLNEGRIENFKEVGFGKNSNDNITINYLVEGLPSEKKNVALTFVKINGEWKISDFTINYHINRKDKANALAFIELIHNQKIDQGFSLLKDYKKEDYAKIVELIGSYPSYKKWVIIDAVNDPCISAKSCATRPNRTKLLFQSPDKNYNLYFVCCNKNDEIHWIESIVIK